jgi:hypothetical protein
VNGTTKLNDEGDVGDMIKEVARHSKIRMQDAKVVAGAIKSFVSSPNHLLSRGSKEKTLASAKIDRSGR